MSKTLYEINYSCGFDLFEPQITEDDNASMHQHPILEQTQDYIVYLDANDKRTHALNVDALDDPFYSNHSKVVVGYLISSASYFTLTDPQTLEDSVKQRIVQKLHFYARASLIVPISKIQAFAYPFYEKAMIPKLNTIEEVAEFVELLDTIVRKGSRKYFNEYLDDFLGDKDLSISEDIIDNWSMDTFDEFVSGLNLTIFDFNKDYLDYVNQRIDASHTD